MSTPLQRSYAEEEQRVGAMTVAEHYAQAKRLLAWANVTPGPAERRANLYLAAQVHATLALNPHPHLNPSPF